ncbi:MAG: aminoacyl-tRNA hydrolase [Candidatus Kerfeldbacteria bacterium]|nr:aminoacyl-tRNA hydrolase [Candidatus Kerfeldbacteria bacterium]
MKLIVGLGNPGPDYEATRHNLGFMVVDELAREHGGTWQKFSSQSATCKLKIKGMPVVLLKPQTFMNESGLSVREAKHFYKVAMEDIWLVHDDLDLEFPRIKLDDNSTAAGHRGVQSVIDQLNNQAFKRFRLGLGRPPDSKPAETFVLEPFSPAEQGQLKAFTKVVTDVIASALKQGFDLTRAELNTKRRLSA